MRALRFVPSAVEGLAGVREVLVTRERLELRVGDRWIRHELASFASARPRHRGHIGQRDRFQARPYFRFFAEPPLTIYMPAGSAGETFDALRELIDAGGYATVDLG